MSPRYIASSLWFSFLLVVVVVPARADTRTQTYQLDGSDTFRIAARQIQSVITYSGIERLTFWPTAGATIFHATVTYAKSDGTSTTRARAAFELQMSPSGDVSREQNDDPDYLTILNQPFSIQLDAPTMHDLEGLAASVPFDFPSPMTGAPLHGTLRRLIDGSLGGVRVLGIAFSAQGPLAGTVPDHPALALDGNITMNGTAYYAYANALLLALDATLLIEGKVGGQAGKDTVSIVYRRSIRPATVETRGR